MIARTWRGQATVAKADAYHRHFTTAVAPHLKDIAGHQGAYLLRREADGQVEFLAVTLWDSIETVEKFAGQNPDVAIVEPEGRAALTEFDSFARHYEVAYSSAGAA
jgi:heme-degrading monooxygenase HmoA